MPFIRGKKSFAVHPGEILDTEFMRPMKISAYRLAKDLDFPGIYDIVKGKRAITADTALRLGKHFRIARTILDESADRLRSASRAAHH